MTTAAWATLIVTWGVITYFTARFFIMVLTKPPKSGDDSD